MWSSDYVRLAIAKAPSGCWTSLVRIAVTDLRAWCRKPIAKLPTNVNDRNQSDHRHVKRRVPWTTATDCGVEAVQMIANGKCMGSPEERAWVFSPYSESTSAR